jgi:hypothetical protein
VEITERWRKLHNEELHNLLCYSDIIRVIKSIRMRGVWHIACMRKIRNSHRILVIKPQRIIPLGRHRNGWKDNIKMNL